MELASSAFRIIPAAVQHFAEYGYDGSSLAKIAEAVGIRKASLYSHFRSKNELFMACFDGAINEEQQCAVALLDEEPGETAPGERYCRSFIRRYPTSRPLQLLLRTAYMPPSSLRAQIDEQFEGYLTLLANGFIAAVRRRSPNAGLPASEATLREVYIAVVDSVQVKLIYTNPELAMYRLDTLQSLLNPFFGRNAEISVG